MVRKCRLDMMAAHRSPADYHQHMENMRQESFQDRTVERILRAGGMQAPELKQFREQCSGDRKGDLTWEWFNENAQFPVSLLGRRLGKLPFHKEIAAMMGKGFVKTLTFRGFQDVQEAYSNTDWHGFVTRYTDVARDMVLHCCQSMMVAGGGDEFYFARKYDGCWYYLQPLDHLVSNALSLWERPHYDPGITFMEDE
jgi:hypothetical protein